MKKLCGVAVAAIMMLGVTSAPAMATPGHQSLPSGGWICRLFPSRCK